MKKKITLLEIFVIIGFLGVMALFFSPKFLNTPEELQHATVRANVDMGVSAIESVFALKQNDSPTEKIAELIAKTLNKTTKNPINKNNKAYVVNSVAEGAVSLITNDSKGSITLKGYAQDIEKPLKVKTLQK